MAENKYENILLNEVKLYWTWLQEPRQMDDGKHKFVAEIGNLTSEQANALHEVGISVRDGKEQKTPQPEKGLFIGSKSVKQPKVVDASAKRLDGEDIPKIGNGTLANVMIRPYEWGPISGRSGVSAGLNGVQILELVELTESESGEMFTPVDKYKAPEVEVGGKGPF